MQLSIVFFVALAVAFVAAGPIESKDAQIVKSDFNLDPAGQYNFGFETDTAIVVGETGVLKNITNEEGKDETIVVVRGAYSYPGEDGKPVSITYFADETGFHAEGDHIPVAPVA